MDEKELQKKIKNGAVLAQVSFEVIGNPKDYVEKTIRTHVNDIKNHPHIKVLNEEFGEPEEIEGGLWSTYVDAEMLFDKLDALNWLCINFTPASIEIISPEELRFSDKDLTNWFNDLLAKLHEISMAVRQTITTDQAVTKNMNALIQNAIIIASEVYHSAEKIAERVGISKEQLQPFLDALIKQEKLEKRGEEYHHKIHKPGRSVSKVEHPKNINEGASEKSVSKHGAKKRD
jgi:hypothetical protein